MIFKERQAKKRNGSSSVAKQLKSVRTEMIRDWLGDMNYGHVPASSSNDDDVEECGRELEERL
ncbi:hypothetical protein HNQ85_000807 [Anoxybacillus calidus]|jgi:hypothetical protein|uniref:Uncharacterized protein n=1 Tax=[Anoxybacillus] calidus TaxID=575178 RepID=A0A7W0BW10_9BACL|nr:hypothetical protein [Anoxybacillus calidus]MBA2870549.1 hypothetical protein [Anoxybacillus calidus]